MAIMITKSELVGLGKWDKFCSMRLLPCAVGEMTDDDEFVIEESDARKLGLIK